MPTTQAEHKRYVDVQAKPMTKQSVVLLLFYIELFIQTIFFVNVGFIKFRERLNIIQTCTLHNYLPKETQ